MTNQIPSAHSPWTDDHVRLLALAMRQVGSIETDHVTEQKWPMAVYVFQSFARFVRDVGGDAAKGMLAKTGLHLESRGYAGRA